MSSSVGAQVEGGYLLTQLFVVCEHADGDQSELSGTLTIEAVREQVGNVRTDARYEAIASLPRIPLPKVCHGLPEFGPENVRF